MSIRNKAYIAGAFEHPTRKAADKSHAQLHAEVIKGALDDAGLSHADVDGYFCAGDAPGVLGSLTMADYLGFSGLRHLDGTDPGGSAPLFHIAHAAESIALGRCRIAVVSLAGKPRTSDAMRGMPNSYGAPDLAHEIAYGITTHLIYGMATKRHMYEYGTTSEQLAWVKVAMSHHAQHNPHAMLPHVVTVEDVLNSPMIADPFHKLDCCVTSDGGGAVVVVAPEIARSLDRPLVAIRGAGEAVKGLGGGYAETTHTAARWSGPRAFEEAGVSPADIKYASIYDSFTGTVVLTLEDLGFCEKGQGGRFVSDGGLISGVGRLPVNTDGGGLCNNHPGARGGITKVIEAVRQLRQEAHPAVQVPNCDLALAHGTGGYIAANGGSATLILERH